MRSVIRITKMYSTRIIGKLYTYAKYSNIVGALDNINKCNLRLNDNSRFTQHHAFSYTEMEFHLKAASIHSYYNILFSAFKYNNYMNLSYNLKLTNVNATLVCSNKWGKLLFSPWPKLLYDIINRCINTMPTSRAYELNTDDREGRLK